MMRNPTLSGFILTYFLTVLAVSLVLSVAYFVMLRTVRENEIEYALANLERTKDLIDTGFEEVGAIAGQLALDPSIRQVQNLQFESYAVPEFYSLIDLKANFPAYTTTNTFADQVYVLVNRLDVLVGRDNATTRPELFYESALKYEGMSYGEWHARMKGTYFDAEIWPVTRVWRGDRTEELVTFLQSIPIGQVSNPRGTVIVLISKATLESMFGGLPIGDAGWFSIADGDRTLYSSEDEATWYRPPEHDSWRATRGYEDLRDTVVVYTASATTGLTYAAGIPRAFLLEQVSRVRRLFLYALAAATAVGLALTVTFAFQQSKPIAKLLSTNAYLRELLDRQKPVIRASVLERLLRGSYDRIQDMEPLLRQAGLAQNEDGFLVCLFRLSDRAPDEGALTPHMLEVNRVSCSEVLSRTCPHLAATHPIETDKVAAIFRWDADSDDPTVSGFLMDVVDSLKRDYGIITHCGLSRRCGRLNEIAAAFREAEEALDYRGLHRGSPIVSFSELPNQSTGYHFPIELELRLIRLIASGDDAEAAEVWGAIYRRNFLEKELTEKEIEQLQAVLEGTFSRIRDSVFSDDPPQRYMREIERLHDFETAEDLDESVRALIEHVASAVNEQKRSHNSRLRDDILQYLRDHYHDPNVNLWLVASEFGLSEKYLSDFFHEQTGITYYSYLVNLRMERAKELMLQGTSVAEVAQLVGYSRKSFSRAFKRVHGFSPTEFLRSIPS